MIAPRAVESIRYVVVHPFGFAWALEALHIRQMPLILTVVAFAAGDDGRSHNDAGVHVFFPSPPTPGAGRGVRGEGFDSILLLLRLRPRCIDIEPLTDDSRRPGAILDFLDPPQDQLGIQLPDGEGAHPGAGPHGVIIGCGG